MTAVNVLAKPYIVISHLDLDGVIPDVLAHHVLPHNDLNQVHFVSNDRVNKKITDVLALENIHDYVIFIVDHSPSREVYDLLVEKKVDYYIFDHHKSSKIKDVEDERFHFSLTECGTSLFKDYLFETYDYSHKSIGELAALDRLTTLTRDYDLWLHTDQDSKDLNTLLYEYGINDFVERYKENLIPLFTEEDSRVVELAERRKDAYFKKSLAIAIEKEDLLGNKYAWLPMEQYHSELGHHIIENKNIEYVMLLDMRKNKVSLRGHGNVDLSKMAEVLGAHFGGEGGGHPPAAGFSYAPEKFVEVYKELFGQ